MVDYIYVEIYDTLRTLKVTKVLDLVVRFLSLWFPFLRKAKLKWDTNQQQQQQQHEATATAAAMLYIKWARERTSKRDE